MLYKSSSTFFLFFSFVSVALFGHNSQKENQEVLLAHLNASRKVVAYAPGAIKNYEDAKLYICENQIYKSSSGSFLCLSSGECLSLPPMPVDSIGPYLVTLNMVDDKFFKNVCNNCGHEWSGGLFDVWCPNCGSTDWDTVRDRD
ncbi:MAG: hypothetical protein COT85_01500 [Chlamydiae bacterium CG10_big_fil_rev_8_21_14_0_10_42_34]|nr:MAG: hypothetical protein COT85_01500 [Chlamydiae bacterium CG10_big_fil_rev_8_21_14_0_10_42_34]